MALCDQTARELRRAIGAREISAVELLESCLERIEATNGAVNAIVAMDEERARADARAADALTMAGKPLGALHGLPVGIKDLNDVEGLPTTHGSLLYENNVAAGDERLVRHLRDSGAIILGKTNTPEFGAGSNTTNEVFGATRNPFQLDHTPGGSSGGSAAALACSMVPLAHGSDTGGSLRAPATWCGVAAIRPTAGLVPSDKRRVPLTFFSVQGPMARTIDDVRLMLDAMVGTSPYDLMSSNLVGAAARSIDLSQIRVGISTDFGVAPVDDGIRATFLERVEAIKGAFASVTSITPDFSTARDTFWILRSVAFLANHLERYREHGDTLSANIRANVEAGLEMSAEQVAWANVEWGKMAESFARETADVDIVLAPGNATPAFLLKDGIPRVINGVSLENYMDASLVRSSLTLTGHPVVALPCGMDHTGMPFGFQIAGKRGEDHRLLDISRAIEALLSTDGALARPVPDLSRLSN